MPGSPTYLSSCRVKSYCACYRCGWSWLDVYSLAYHLSLSISLSLCLSLSLYFSLSLFLNSLSLSKLARYRLKYCIKGPLHLNNQTTNQPTFISLQMTLVLSVISYALSVRDRVCSIVSDAGKFYLAHGLRQLTRDVKHEIRTLNFRSDVTFAPPRKKPNDVQKILLCDINIKNKRNDG